MLWSPGFRVGRRIKKVAKATGVALESARGGPCPHLPTCTFRGALWAAALQEGVGGGALLVELSPSELGLLGCWDS